MKNLLYTIFLGLIVWVVYTTFFGNSEEKAMRDRLLGGLKETGSAIGDILTSQKGRYVAGEYDGALSKLSIVIDQLKNAKGGPGENAEELARLEKQKAELEQLIANYEKNQAAFEQAQQQQPKEAQNAKRSLESIEKPTTEPLERKLEEIQGTLQQIEQ